MAEDARPPVIIAIESDLESTAFKVGAARRMWRLVEAKHPEYTFAVTEQSEGGDREVFFRFELTGYPTAAPKAHIWDLPNGQILAPSLRPSRNELQRRSFQDWGDRTVYRPWERCSGAHNNWNTTYTKFAWNPSLTLSYALNDIYQILNR